MSIYINSPSYYTQIYGIDDKVYKVCRLLEKNIDVKNYTSLLDTIGITPIVAPVEEICDNKCQEVRHISLGCRMASISLHVDYSAYISAIDQDKKLQLIIDNILNSLLIIKKRLKKGFDYEQIKKDILTLVNDCLMNNPDKSVL